MPALALALDTRSDAFVANRAHTLALIDQWRAITAATVDCTCGSSRMSQTWVEQMPPTSSISP